MTNSIQSGARLCASIAGLILVLSCKLGPTFQSEPPTLGDRWQNGTAPQLVGQPVSDVEWWKSLSDPVLDAFIEEAFAENLSLHAASLRIVQARIGRAAAAELLFPTVTAGGSIMHLNQSETVSPDINVSVPTVTVNTPPIPPPDPLVEVSGKLDVSVTPKIDIYDVGFDAMWEPDIWGEKRRRIEAAGESLRAAYASYDDIMVSLSGEVASTYIQIRVLETRLANMQKNLAVLREFEAIAVDRYEKKESPETDFQLARTLIAIIAAGVPSMEAGLGHAKNSLCVLLGKTPFDLESQLAGGVGIPAVGFQIAVGIPADLVRRRPDIRIAEHLAHAQCARIGMAKANILPSMSVLGSIGYKSSDSDLLFESESVAGAYGVAANATGLIMYPFTVEKVRMEDAQFQESLINYQATVLNAVREVENVQLSFIKSLELVPILSSGSVAAARSSELAVGAYKQGKVIVSVPLVALSFKASLEDQEIAARGQAANNLIAVYKALGGGWENRTEAELVPGKIREQMKERSDWWSFAGKHELNTVRRPK